MGIEYCDGILFRKLFVGGTRWVALHRRRLNDINVYPVPDGDTGTNIYLTLRGALAACTEVRGTSLGSVLSVISRGALMNARGNSGVILSQIIAGFSRYFRSKEYLYASDLAGAFRSAAERAYKSVSEPREGTVLTVVREMAELLESHSFPGNDLVEALEFVHKESRKILRECRDLLPVLKESNVLDAGGQGLVYLLEGMKRAACYENIARQLMDTAHESAASRVEVTSRENRYCIEFIVDSHMHDIAEVKKDLEVMGNSLVAADLDNILKIHLHTDTPEDVRTYVESLGTVLHEKMDDMHLQHRELVIRDEVADGERFSVVFR